MSHIFPVLGVALKEERKKEREKERKEERKEERERKKERKGRKEARKKKPLQWNMVQNMSAQSMTSAMNSRMEATLILVPPFFATENCDMDPRRGGPHCGRLRGLPTRHWIHANVPPKLEG